MQSKTIPSREDIVDAHNRIRHCIHRTPVFRCRQMDDLFEACFFFKCENFQRVGAFKMRGASNAVLSLSDDELKVGVATHSSGNHAQALALAAKEAGTKCWIVMPENAPKVKSDAVLGYGAEIIFCEATIAARERTLKSILEKTGAIFIPPFNDYRIIAGQATAALELIEDSEKLDVIVAPIGGGGLLSGSALSAKYFSPGTEVWGAEPKGACDAWQGFQSGKMITEQVPKTIADGLLTTMGDKTFEIILKEAKGIGLAEEETIIRAMHLVWERMKIIVEPSSAVPLAAIMDGNIPIKGKKVGIIFSGGNVDLANLPWQKK